MHRPLTQICIHIYQPKNEQVIASIGRCEACRPVGPAERWSAEREGESVCVREREREREGQREREREGGRESEGGRERGRERERERERESALLIQEKRCWSRSNRRFHTLEYEAFIFKVFSMNFARFRYRSGHVTPKIWAL